MQRVIRVLVVDDSAFIRKVVSQMLSRSPFIEVVGTARDADEALEQVAEKKPDVVTLDLIMPGRLDGVGFLREQMARAPVPVVVCSIAHDSGETALAALDAGAVDFVQKPTALATEKVFDIAEELVAKVKAAATVQMGRLLDAGGAHADAAASAGGVAVATEPAKRRVDIVVIGLSTGGPQALRQLLPRFGADFPVPIAVVLHMPVGYTDLFARRIDEISALHVMEARHGDLIRPGTALLAPAGRHLTFRGRPDGTVSAHLDQRPFDTQHRPSVDVLFRAAADTFDGRVLGVVMTGMGDDGLMGAAHIKAAGGRILTEAQSSCVVYGMPRAVDEATLSDRSVPLDSMAESIIEML
jgi:two-component system chemotaxis response regulator CheB